MLIASAVSTVRISTILFTGTAGHITIPSFTIHTITLHGTLHTGQCHGAGEATMAGDMVTHITAGDMDMDILTMPGEATILLTTEEATGTVVAEVITRAMEEITPMDNTDLPEQMFTVATAAADLLQQQQFLPLIQEDQEQMLTLK